MGIQPRWMVYNGKSYEHRWFGGTPILGNYGGSLKWGYSYRFLDHPICRWDLNHEVNHPAILGYPYLYGKPPVFCWTKNPLPRPPAADPRSSWWPRSLRRVRRAWPSTSRPTRGGARLGGPMELWNTGKGRPWWNGSSMVYLEVKTTWKPYDRWTGYI